MNVLLYDRYRMVPCIVTGFAVAISGCAMQVASEAEEAVEVDAVEEPVLSGNTTSSQPAIGRLEDAGGNLRCTATLISSRVILTAAHCFNYDTTMSGLGQNPNFA